MAKYELIQPPFVLRFHEMSERELNAYFTWFFDILPARIAEMTRAVKGTPEFEHWQDDLTPVSLEQLGTWFAEVVETRSLTDAEMDYERGLNPFPIADSYFDTTLTDRTFSVAMDVGMYFGSVIERNIPSARWFQPRNDKRFAYYGEACLSGFGVHTLCPFGLVTTLALAIADGERDGTGLRRLFDVWAELVP